MGEEVGGPLGVGTGQAAVVRPLPGELRPDGEREHEEEQPRGDDAPAAPERETGESGQHGCSCLQAREAKTPGD